MENASKALLMAAGVLMGVLILSLVAYLTLSFGSASRNIHKQKEEQELNKFNSQFSSYEKKEGLTIYDVLTVRNIATENNKYYEFKKRRDFNLNDNYVAVKINNIRIEGGIDGYFSRDYMDSRIEKNLDSISEDSPSLVTYTCSVKYSPITNRVYLIEFTEG